jgi:ketosteroid isomerase-like protein
MAGDQGEKLRDLFDHWSRGDFTAGADLFHPEVEFVIGPDFPDTGTYTGLEGVNRYTRGFLEPWDRITITPLEIEEEGDCFVVEVLQSGTGMGSGAPTEFRYFQVWAFEGDRVVYWENFRGRDEALAAARARA